MIIKIQGLGVSLVLLGFLLLFPHAIYVNDFSGDEVARFSVQRTSLQQSTTVLYHSSFGPIRLAPEMNDIRLTINATYLNSADAKIFRVKVINSKDVTIITEERYVSGQSRRSPIVPVDSIVNRSTSIAPLRIHDDDHYIIDVSIAPEFETISSAVRAPESISVEVRRSVATLNFPLVLFGLASTLLGATILIGVKYFRG